MGNLVLANKFADVDDQGIPREDLDICGCQKILRSWARTNKEGGKGGANTSPCCTGPNARELVGKGPVVPAEKQYSSQGRQDPYSCGRGEPEVRQQLPDRNHVNDFGLGHV